ncbi:hypothetical protein CC85DRAFT_328428 [Cutaneotrichosporon oleaginosum]|uniref:Uncharacterized protein n=1 Tax=Cutaneotrichosporon oleaginosum TaxID=879819 RepID=A0A0J0XM58_9TREE|nr:uncharacterized protein CC85DRAFT_328428 [Cutaneotrichosporon oleaginosum]KLT42201.1 hypothetical protein CC85DRAFT_328428 [Cutaneotrichosporon oleaginosum]TXT11680.1 hypothetical protein COLE_02090 [Cutaneotrichosporon oleaginosum]
MSMPPPPPPSRHRSTASAPIPGLPIPSTRPFGTPTRPAPASAPAPAHHGTPTRPTTPSTSRPTYPSSSLRPIHHASDRSINSTPTTSFLSSSSQATPSQPIHPLAPMSGASSISAASAAVDSPLPTASRIIEPAHSRTTSEQTRSGLRQSAPSTPAHRVSRSVGAYPVSPSVEARRQGLESPSRAKLVEPNLPSAPTVWTPSELAQYLSWALRTGGNDGQGPTLPSPVIEDVVSWVLRSQVTGRQFATGVDQGVARPPPFLPVLAVVSRRLRRTGSRLSECSTSTDASAEEKEVTRVRRLAHAFEHISSASEASGDEASLSVLREQLTGESVHGFGRAAPRPEARNWSRRDSVASVASIASGISAASHARWRPSADSTTVWVTHDEDVYAAGNASPTAPLRAKAEAKAALELAELAGLAKDNSPPPPYAPSPARSFAPTTPPRARDSSPEPASPSPSPSPSASASAPASASPPSPSHMARMGAHRSNGVDPYAVLRQRPAPDKPHWTTTRRASGTPGSLRRRREAAMAREVAALTDRIRELEARLAAVETPADSPAGSVPDAGEKPGGEKPKPRPRGLLAALGLADEHGNQPRLQDLPALLFLLGVGVGAGGCAVIVRVLLQRRITA